MDKSANFRKWMIAAVVAAVLFAIVAVVAVTRSDDGRDTNQVVTSSMAPPSDAAASSGTNYPGAMVGNTQRTWPDPDGQIDDSVHATPGTWSVDLLFQRPVWTPINHDGDLPKESALVNGGFEQCSAGQAVLSGDTTQQYVNARYLIVNSEAGPTRMIDGVPAGFAHSPQGAITFALNLMSYGIAGQGDGIGEEIDTAWWSTYETLQKDREFRGLNKPDYDHTKNRAELVPGPGFYAVTQCTENVVVVEIGLDYTDVGSDALKTTIPLFWRDGDWIPDLTGQAGVTFDRGGTFDPASPGELKEVNYQ